MENKILLNLIQDRYDRFQRAYTIVTTDFLDLSQQSAAAAFVKSHRNEGAFFYGGYEDSERRQVIFVPDYLGIASETDLSEYFFEEPDECPLTVLDVSVRERGAELKHSDYLGSLLALGIKREKTGDIVVRNGGAQILVNREIAGYLAENYIKAGRTPIDVKVLPISELVVTKPNIEDRKAVISSARLDNVVAAIFGVSRKASSEAINRGLVFVDNVETKKTDYFLKGGEKIVLRGKGKAVYNGSSGTSRKGKLYIDFGRYI